MGSFSDRSNNATRVRIWGSQVLKVSNNQFGCWESTVCASLVWSKGSRGYSPHLQCSFISVKGTNPRGWNLCFQKQGFIFNAAGHFTLAPTCCLQLAPEQPWAGSVSGHCWPRLELNQWPTYGGWHTLAVSWASTPLTWMQGKLHGWDSAKWLVVISASWARWGRGFTAWGA